MRLTVGVADVINLGQGQALAGGRTTAQLDNIGHGLECGEALGRGRRGPVLGDPQLPGLRVLELDLEDAVGLLRIQVLAEDYFRR